MASSAGLSSYAGRKGEAGRPLLKRFPGCKHALNRRRCFSGAWQLPNRWNKSEMPCQWPPLPPFCALGIAGLLVTRNQLRAAAFVVCGYHTFLRTGEMLSMQPAHVTWSHGLRQGFLWLPLTKSGQRAGAAENIPFDDDLCCGLLQAVCGIMKAHFDAPRHL